MPGITQLSMISDIIFTRPDFGHLSIEIIIDDPKAYTRPWSVTVNQDIMLDTDLIEFVCNENEKSSQHFR